MSDTVDWIAGAPEELRAWRASRPEVLNPTLPDDVTINMLAPKGDCPGGLSFHPTDESGTPVVYFHGGGFVVGSPETHRINCAWIAHLTQAPVYSIRYRLAPEYILPAQLADAVAAIRRQLAYAAHLHLMGDSAGGLVALWGYAGLTPAERARIRSLVLFYPAAGMPLAPSPDDAARDRDGLGPKSVEAMYQRLDPDHLLRGSAVLDPLSPDFPELPMLTILAAAHDPVLADAEALAARHSCRLIVAPDLDHAFLASLPAAPELDLLRDALGL